MTRHEGNGSYIERGLYVFTAEEMRRWGSCCASGCRHCPYWPPHSGSHEPAPDGLDAARRHERMPPGAPRR
jgi:hypothetical protein